MNAPNELSFLPDDYMERKAQRRTNAICGVLFFITMLAIGSAFTLTERSLRDVERDHANVDRDFTEAAKRIKQVQEMQEKQRTMAHQAELSSSLLEKVPRSFVLAELTNDLPAGVSLTDFTLESKRRVTNVSVGPGSTAFERQKAQQQRAAVQSTPEAKLYDVYMKISGLASTDVQVASLIARLNASKTFKEVNLIISDNFVQADEQFRKFQIELMIDPVADVQQMPDKTKTAAVEIK